MTTTFKRGDRVQVRHLPARVGTFVRIDRIAGRGIVSWDGDDVLGAKSEALSDLQHAPVRVVGRYQTCSHSYCTKPARVGHDTCAGHDPLEMLRLADQVKMKCPQCGGVTEVQEAEKVETHEPYTRVPVIVRGCTACEWLQEVV